MVLFLVLGIPSYWNSFSAFDCILVERVDSTSIYY